MTLQNLAVPRLSMCLLALAVFSAASSQAQTPSFSGKIVNQSLGSTTVALNVGVTNTSSAAATNVTITSVTARVTLGTGPLSLAAPSLPLLLGTINPSASVTASLTLNASPGVRRFSVVENGTAKDSAGNSYQFSLSQVVNVAFASITFGTTAIDFGTQTVGGPSSSFQSVSVYNNGALPVSFSSITASGDFVVGSYSGCPQSLAAAASCYVSVSFSPTAPGPRTGTLTLNDNAFGNPQTVTLTGTGQTPQPILNISPSSLSFGTQRLGSPISLGISLNNAGAIPENFSSVAITGPNASDFLIGSNSCGNSVGVQQYCNISVTFIPSAAGSRTASLVLTDSVSGSIYTIPVSGTGQTTTTLSLPASLTFAPQAVNTTSPASYIAVSNTGTTPISFTSFTVTGPNASDFAITQNQCLSGLPISSQCQIAIQLTPSSAGPRTATLTIVDNAVGSPHTVALSTLSQTGTGTIALSTTTINFFSQYVGTASYQNTLYVQNTGNVPVAFSSFTLSGMNPTDFSIASNQCSGSIAPQSYCFIGVVFTPSVAGNRTAALTLVDTAADSPQTLILNGTGATPPVVTFNPSAVSFPATNTGSTVSQDISISNTGTVPLTFYSFYLGGNNSGDFSISANSCPSSGTFAAGSSCTVTIAFTPPAGSPRTAFLSISDNTTTSPHIIFLGGNGAVPTQSLAFSNLILAFGNSPVGSTSGQQQYFTVTNTGNAIAQISSISVTGANSADFTINGNSSNCNSLTNQTLSPNQSCSVSVLFTPTAPGPRTAQLTFTDTAIGSPQSITLTGTGTAAGAGVVLNTSELDFTATPVSTVSYQQSVIFTNSSSTPLNVSVSLTGDNAADFVIEQNTCALDYNNVLPAGVSCFVYLNFIPTVTGNRKASLLFTDAALSSPQTVVLTGIGAAPAESLSVAPASLNFSAQTVGIAASSLTISLTNSGNSPITFSAYTLAGVNANDFTISSNSCLVYQNNVLPAKSSCSIALTFTPQDSGNRTAVLSVASDAPSSPFVVTLQGVGVPAGALIAVAPTTLNFVAPVGATSSAQTVTVFNTGIQGAGISSLAITGSSGFRVSYGTCSTYYLPFGACTLQITYTPQATGTTAATLGIVTPGGNLAVALNGSGVSATKTLSVSSSLQFPNPQGIGISTLAQALTIQNTGNEPVALTSFTLSGVNSSDFTIAANSCPASLLPSLNCTLGVLFTPSSTGNRTATLTISDDASGAPHAIALSGTGILAQKTVAASSGSWDFGPLNLGSASAPVAFQWTNTGVPNVTVTGISVTGANAADFTITQTNCTLGLVIPSQSSPSIPNYYCSASIVFTPSGPGLRSAAVQLADDAIGSPQSITLSGVGQPLNANVAVPASVAFGTATVGKFPITQVVTISNTGDAPVTFGIFSLGGANASDFTITQNYCLSLANTLPLAANCSVTIAFSPVAGGLRTASLQISDNASGSPQTVLLQGTGQSGPATLTLNTPSIYFGTVPLGQTQQPSVGLYLSVNGGSITVSSIAITGPNAAEFSITQNQCASAYPSNVIPDGGYCYLTLAFNPSSALGSRSAAFVVTDNASNGTLSVPITAFVAAPTRTLSLAPAAIDFGVEAVGNTTTAQNVSVGSTGNSLVTFTNFAINGANAADFAISNNSCATGVSAPFGCSIQVTFTPSAIGTRTAALTLTDNATGGVQNIPLAGIGQPARPALVVAPAQLAFRAPVSGVNPFTNPFPTTKNVFFTNTGTSNISFSAATISGPNSADFAINYNACANPGYYANTSSLLPGAQCTVSITFNPTIVGVENATLSVTDSGSAVPQTVPLVGLGIGPQKVLTVSSNIVSFSSAVGNTTTSGNYISNGGNADVTLSSVTILGANASEFTLASSSCQIGSPITYNCSLNVNFTPSQPGIRTAIMQLTDDASNSTTNVYLVGNAVVPQSLITSNYGSTFQPTPVNASATGFVFFSNYTGSPVTIAQPVVAGVNVADFSINNVFCPNPLPANGSCEIEVTFTPSAQGFRYATVQVNFAGSGGFPATATLAGIGVGGSGYMTLETAGLEFDATTINQTSLEQYVAFLNTGQGAVQLGPLTFSGANAGDFTASANYCYPSAGPGGTCSISVQFIPTGAGLRTATLNIAGNAANSPQTVSVIGIGQAPSEVLYASSTGVSFPPTAVNGNSSAGVSLLSGGSSSVTLSNVAITGDNASEFTLSSSYCPTVFSSSCSIYLQFAPLAAGLRTASLSITSDAPGSPLIIPLNGIGLNPSDMITFSSSVVDFGFANVNSPALYSAWVTNSGNIPVNFSAPSLTGTNAADFTVTSPVCGALAPGASCNVSLAFIPSDIGPRTANLQLNDDAPGSPQTVALQGVGQVVSKLLTSSASIVDFGVKDVGAIATTWAVSVVNSGSAALNIGSIAISGANAQDFHITSTSANGYPSASCATLAVSSNCYVYLSFTPSIAGPETATLVVSSDSSAGPVIISLAGVGQTPSKRLTANTNYLDFGSSTIGGSNLAQTVIVNNTGTDPVVFTAPSISGPNAPNFSISSQTCGTVIQPTSSCGFALSFAPSNVGSATASLVINSTAANGPITINLIGVGTAASGPIVNVASPVAFGTQSVGSGSVPQSAFVYNVGTSPLTVSSTTFGGANASDFRVVAPLAGATILPGGSQAVGVQFIPSAAGLRTATIIITDSAPGSPHMITLTGVGQ